MFWSFLCSVNWGEWWLFILYFVARYWWNCSLSLFRLPYHNWNKSTLSYFIVLIACIETCTYQFSLWIQYINIQIHLPSSRWLITRFSSVDEIGYYAASIVKWCILPNKIPMPIFSSILKVNVSVYLYIEFKVKTDMWIPNFINTRESCYQPSAYIFIW
jgi:hypothetical protein